MIQAENIHLYDYLQVIIRRRWAILTFFIVLVVTVLIGTLKQTRIYEAVTTLRIERSSPKVISVEQVTPMGDMANSQVYKDYYETQYKIILSPTTLKETAKALGMATEISGRNQKDPVKQLQKAVKVLPVKNSQLVEIKAEDPDPKMAARIANTLADEYIKRNLETSMATSASAAEWLQQKIDEQGNKLKDADIALQKYREAHNIKLLPEASMMQQDTALEDVKTEYTKLQAQLASYSERYTDEHPAMIELKAQLDSMRNKIQGLGDVNTSNDIAEFRVLERNVQTNKRMYDALLSRMKEIDIAGTLNVNNISILDRAEAPEKPSKPNLVLNMVLAVMVGLVMGVGLGFFLDYLDATIKSPQDVKDILGLHFLGGIPKIKDVSESERDKVVHLRPASPEAEAYRHIRTEILNLISDAKGPKAMMITSAEPQAGKTITSVNIAIALAMAGHRVLLIDSDLRRAQLHRVFGYHRADGFCDYITENRGLDSILKDTEIKNLKIITSGRKTENPSEVIGSERVKTLIQEGKEKFDLVLFDSPPVLSVTDAVVLADKVDASVVVVRSGKIFAPAAMRVKEKLAMTKAKLLGVILNELRSEHGGYYDYYHYYGEEGTRRSGRHEKKENLKIKAPMPSAKV